MTRKEAIEALKGCPVLSCGACKIAIEALEKQISKVIEANCDTCVCCGEYVPEGRMVCCRCEKDSRVKIL